MENASKALIIAGAILISILLISVAMLILNSISSVTEETESYSKTMAAQIYNQNFSSYLGNSVPGSEVKALLSKIIINNLSSKNEPILVNAYSIFASKKTHQKTQSQLQAILDKISVLANYSVTLTTGCSKYTNGIRSDGTFGCITIKKL